MKIKNCWKILAVLAFLNIAVIDAGLWRADNSLRAFRDMGCDDVMRLNQASVDDPQPQPANNSTSVFWITAARTDYSLFVMSFTDERNGHLRQSVMLHLYGCDVNGKKYRLWLQR